MQSRVARRVAVTVGLAVGLAVCWSVTPAPAVDAEGFKVGYINLDRIFSSYEQTQASDAALEQKGKRKEAELEGRVKELQKLRQSLELLNDEAREARAREIEDKVDDLQRFRASTVRELGRERDKVAKQILEDIEGSVNEYAKANGFSLILDSRSLFFSESAYDVTDEILAILNSRVRKARR